MTLEHLAFWFVVVATSACIVVAVWSAVAVAGEDFERPDDHP